MIDPHAQFAYSHAHAHTPSHGQAPSACPMRMPIRMPHMHAHAHAQAHLPFACPSACPIRIPISACSSPSMPMCMPMRMPHTHAPSAHPIRILIRMPHSHAHSHTHALHSAAHPHSAHAHRPAILWLLGASSLIPSPPTHPMAPSFPHVAQQLRADGLLWLGTQHTRHCPLGAPSARRGAVCGLPACRRASCLPAAQPPPPMSGATDALPRAHPLSPRACPTPPNGGER